MGGFFPLNLQVQGASRPLSSLYPSDVCLLLEMACANNLSQHIKMSQSLFTRQGPHAICATVQDRRTITPGFIRSLDSSYLSNCPGQTASGALVLRQANSERNVDPSRLQTFGGKLGRLRKTLVRNSPGIYIALDSCVILNWCLICHSFLRFRFRGFSFYVTFSLTGCQVGLMQSIKAKLS